MSIPKGALPIWEPRARDFPRVYSRSKEIGKSIPRNGCRSRFWEPKAQEFPRSYFRNGEMSKSIPQDECRSLGARFHSGSRRHGNVPAPISETNKLVNRFRCHSGSRKHGNFLVSETVKFVTICIAVRSGRRSVRSGRRSVRSGQRPAVSQ